MPTTAFFMQKENKKKIKSALISVFNKDGLEDIINLLHKHEIKIISTGGTAKFIKELKVPVIEVENITNFPSVFGGRVKTLHPKIHGGLLARRDNPEHMKQAEEHGIKMIDLVVVNLLHNI